MTDKEKLVGLLNEASHISADFCTLNDCETCNYSGVKDCFSTIEADHLIANGVRIPVFCKDCKWFMEYTEEYKQTVEKADGDCYHRILNSENSQFCGRCYGDYCSDGKRRDSDER